MVDYFYELSRRCTSISIWVVVVCFSVVAQLPYVTSRSENIPSPRGNNIFLVFDEQAKAFKQEKWMLESSIPQLVWRVSGVP